MKKAVLLLSLGCLMVAMMAFVVMYQPAPGQPTESKKSKTVIGRWERTFPKVVWIWDIRANGTFSVSSEGKAFANGQYRVKNGIYDINDANCNANYHGQYRFVFLPKIRYDSRWLPIPVANAGTALMALDGNVYSIFL